MRWALRLLILCYLIMSFQIHARVVFAEKLSPTFKGCIELIYNHPITTLHYPLFLMRDELTTEINNYCSCIDTQENLLKNNMANQDLNWIFRNPEKQLTIKDKCALDNFQEFSTETSYAIYLTSQIDPFLEQKLKRHFGAHYRTVASDNSIHHKVSCLKSKFYSKCNKIKSLGVTYACIHQNLKDNEFIDQIQKECPEFSPDEYSLQQNQSEYL